ncbi:hypothetical protein AXK11_07655 [Cephaloticoccus primus]|uniref:Uncharacterized protein n=1 Tax=Cephaloticoccus primus TaxID=1548207 RepID=A0A139SJJ1_9BACT|nr:hypothetical protein AXK11_07655 [Cephaloticoccus primus]
MLRAHSITEKPKVLIKATLQKNSVYLRKTLTIYSHIFFVSERVGELRHEGQCAQVKGIYNCINRSKNVAISLTDWPIYDIPLLNLLRCTGQ